MTEARPNIERVLDLDVAGKPRPRSLRRRAAVLAIVAVGVAAALFFLARHRGAAQAPRWVTQPVKVMDLNVTVSTTGNIEGSGIVSIGAEVTGKVLSVAVDYNDRVTKGQLLAELDPEQLHAAVDEASAQVLAAEANIETAKATRLEARQAKTRAEEQAAQGLISRKDLESALASAARAEASVASATASASLSKASLKSARSKLGKTKIHAPIDGVVLSRSVEPGQTVTAGFTTPELFKLAADLRNLVLEVAVDEADVGRVREGMSATFTVDAWPSRTFPSKVMSLHNDPTTSSNVVTYLAVLSVDNADHALRPGMTATATITSETLPGARVVPNAALRFLPPTESHGFGPPQAITSPKAAGDEKHVYVLRNGSPVMVGVRTGASDGRFTQIVSGDLEPSDEVITDVATQR